MDERFAGRGLKVISVSIDSSPATAGLLARQVGATFPVVLDEGRKISTAYGVDSIPRNVVIGRDGRIDAVFGYSAEALKAAAERAARG